MVGSVWGERRMMIVIHQNKLLNFNLEVERLGFNRRDDSFIGIFEKFLVNFKFRTIILLSNKPWNKFEYETWHFIVSYFRWFQNNEISNSESFQIILSQQLNSL